MPVTQLPLPHPLPPAALSVFPVMKSLLRFVHLKGFNPSHYMTPKRKPQIHAQASLTPNTGDSPYLFYLIKKEILYMTMEKIIISCPR